MATHVHQLVERERNDTPNPAPKKIIQVSCSWMNIFNVDTVEQTFEVDMVVRLHWMERATERVLSHFTELREADGKKYNISKEDFVKNCWDPQFQFPNCRDMSQTEEWARMDRQGDHIRVCYAVRFHSATFGCIFNLRDFPFDQQSLVVRICSSWDERAVQFRAKPKDSFRQSYDDYNLQDYALAGGRLVDVECPDARNGLFQCRSDAASSTSGARYNSIFLLQNVRRNPGFYLLNLYLPTFLITSCSFVAFAILAEDFSGRSSILVVLLLTVVAFKQVIGQYLPRLPYLTYLDRYALASMSLVVAIGIIHSALAAASVCVDEPQRKPNLCGNLLGTTLRTSVDHADYVCLVVSGVVWILYQLFEVLAICYARKYVWSAPDVQEAVAPGGGDDPLPLPKEDPSSTKLETKEEKTVYN